MLDRGLETVGVYASLLVDEVVPLAALAATAGMAGNAALTYGLNNTLIDAAGPNEMRRTAARAGINKGGSVLSNVAALASGAGKLMRNLPYPKFQPLGIQFGTEISTAQATLNAIAAAEGVSAVRVQGNGASNALKSIGSAAIAGFSRAYTRQALVSMVYGGLAITPGLRLAYDLANVAGMGARGFLLANSTPDDSLVRLAQWMSEGEVRATGFWRNRLLRQAADDEQAEDERLVPGTQTVVKSIVIPQDFELRAPSIANKMFDMMEPHGEPGLKSRIRGAFKFVVNSIAFSGADLVHLLNSENRFQMKVAQRHRVLQNPNPAVGFHTGANAWYMLPLGEASQFEGTDRILVSLPPLHIGQRGFAYFDLGEAIATIPADLNRIVLTPWYYESGTQRLWRKARRLAHGAATGQDVVPAVSIWHALFFVMERAIVLNPGGPQFMFVNMSGAFETEVPTAVAYIREKRMRYYQPIVRTHRGQSTHRAIYLWSSPLARAATQLVMGLPDAYDLRFNTLQVLHCMQMDLLQDDGRPRMFYYSNTDGELLLNRSARGGRAQIPFGEIFVQLHDDHDFRHSPVATQSMRLKQFFDERPSGLREPRFLVVYRCAVQPAHQGERTLITRVTEGLLLQLCYIFGWIFIRYAQQGEETSLIPTGRWPTHKTAGNRQREYFFHVPDYTDTQVYEGMDEINIPV